jgi:hypothetical protein
MVFLSNAHAAAGDPGHSQAAAAQPRPIGEQFRKNYGLVGPLPDADVA